MSAIGSSDQRLVVEVVIVNRLISALVDTGAVFSYVDEPTSAMLCREGLVLEHTQHPQARTATGSLVRAVGEFRTRCEVDGRGHDIQLISLPGLTTPLVLGMDFLRRIGAIIDVRRGQVRTSASESESAAIAAVEECSMRESDLESKKSPPRPGVTMPAPTNDQAVEQRRLDEFLAQQLPKVTTNRGVTPFAEHVIKLTDTTPRKQRYTPRNPLMQGIINAEVDKMLAEGVIEESDSPWSSPTVIVKKKDGKHRFCIDFRVVNSVSEPDAYPLPPIQATLDKLRGARCFTTIDLKSGYWQVPLAKESRPITAFTVPGRGLFQFRVMPFGLHAAPATFQRLLDKVIGPKMEPFAFAYLDDIVVASKSMEEHLEHLQQVFARLAEANLQVNPEKCHFGKESIRYLGHVIDKEGIHTDPDKVAAIRDIPAPTTVKKVRQFLGAASWYRRFVPEFSKLAAPLTKLTHKTQRWIWGEDQQNAFEKLKEALTSAPVLTCPDFAKPFTLQTDASNLGVGAALIQYHGEVPHVIAYASRTLNEREQKYSVTEKECLAVVWGIEKFKPYIEGYYFVVMTDHQALKWLNNIQSPSGRLARWALYLQQFQFEIVYRKGKYNQLADALSRNPVDPAPALMSVDYGDVRCAWFKNKYHDVIANPEDFPDYRVEGEKLFRRFWDPLDLSETEPHREWKQCVPSDVRNEVMQVNHDRAEAGHLGVAKTIARIMLRFYWPGMSRDIARYVRSCASCQRYKPGQHGVAGKMQMPRIKGPWDTVCVDLVGPLPRTAAGHEYLIVCQDRCTKYVECRALRKATGAAVARAIRELVICRYGCPISIISDNGTEFENNSVKKMLAEYQVRHHLTPPYSPQCNPVERVNRVLKPMIAQFCENNHRSWDVLLPEFIFAINTARHSSTGYSPAYLVFGKEPTLPGTAPGIAAEDEDGSIEPTTAQHQHRIKCIQEARELARVLMARASTTQARHYNLRRRDVRFHLGDRVMRREHPLSNAARGFAAKLAPRYSGPWTICKVRSPQVYDLKGERGKKLLRIHIKDMKPVTSGED